MIRRRPDINVIAILYDFPTFSAGRVGTADKSQKVGLTETPECVSPYAVSHRPKVDFSFKTSLRQKDIF
jgi:hypothetical protein